MALTTLVRRTAIGILWLLALWNSWECRGLFADGAEALTEAARKGWFFNFEYQTREYALGASQIPLVLGLKLGVTDLHCLGRLFSFGLFALPTVLYQIALMRAKDDAVLLAAVIAAISLVFLTTSVFIVGEYNTAYAIAIATAAWVVTSDRPRLDDGIFLVVLAVLALRTYEVFVYLGPLLAAMIVCAIPRDLPGRRWLAGNALAGSLMLVGLLIAVTALAFLGIFPAPLFVAALLATTGLVGWWHPQSRPGLAGALWLLAALLFLAGAALALDSAVRTDGGTVFRRTVLAFRWNIQFDFVIAAALVVVVWSLVKPADLGRARPYLWASPFLVLLALLPLVPFGDAMPPLGTHHYEARTMCGTVIASIVAFIWVRWAYGGTRLAVPGLAVLGVLRQPEIARRVLRFSFATLLAMLPSEIAATTTWISFLDTVRKTVQTREGTIAYESLPPEIPYYSLHVVESLPNLSLAVRSRPTDGVIAPPRDSNQQLPPPLGEYFWRN